MGLEVLARLRAHFFCHHSDGHEPSIVQRITRGAFWSLVGEVAVKGFTLVSSILVARLLGREGFGTFGMLQSTLGMFGVLAGFGLGSTATKYVAEYRKTEPERVGAITYLAVAIGAITAGAMMAVCIVMAPWIADTTLNRPDLSGLLMVGSLMLAGLVVGGVLNATLSGFEAFRALTQVKIWQGVVGALTAVLLAWYWGVSGAIVALVITATFSLLISAQAVRHQFRLNKIPASWGKQVWREWPVLHRFAIPALVSSLLVMPTIWVTNAMLVQQPNGYGELGLFNAANQWRTFVVFLPVLLANAMLPVLSETYARTDRTEFTRAISINLRATWIVALPMTMLVIALGPELSLLFGKQFEGMERILPLLMVSTFLSVVCSPVGAALAGSEKMWTGTLMNLGWSGFLILFSWLLVPVFGGVGLATAYLLAYLLHTVWVMAYVRLKLAPDLFVSLTRLIAFSISLIATGLLISNIVYTASRFFAAGFFLLSCIPLGKAVYELLARLYSRAPTSQGKVL